MDRRLQLQSKLEELLGSRNVYFQPPESMKLKYDCIVYSLSRGNTRHADNKPYNFKRSYQIMFISRSPESPMIEKLANAFPGITLDQAYASDGLNHYSYTLYF